MSHGEPPQHIFFSYCLSLLECVTVKNSFNQALWCKKIRSLGLTMETHGQLWCINSFEFPLTLNGSSSWNLLLWGTGFITVMNSMLGNRVKTEGFSHVWENILFTGSFIQVVHYCVGKFPVIPPHVGGQKGITQREQHVKSLGAWKALSYKWWK